LNVGSVGYRPTAFGVKRRSVDAQGEGVKLWSRVGVSNPALRREKTAA